MKPRRFVSFLHILLLFVLYFSTARLGLMMGAVSGFATLVWPPSGIALAALLLFGYRLWPGIALGALLVNLLAGAPFFTASGMALGNTLEALIGAYLLQRHNFNPSLHRLQDALNLVILAALSSTLISATIGVLSLFLGGVIATSALLSTWGSWWIGDALGDLVVASLLLVWSRGLRFSKRRPLEYGAFMLCLFGISLLFFAQVAPTGLTTILLPYLVFPLTIWAALRLGVQATVTATFVLSAVAITATVMKVGPFAQEPLTESLALIHLFMVAVAVTSLTLASAMAERVSTDELIKESQERISAEERIRSILDTADAFISIDAQGVIRDWNPQSEETFGWKAKEAIGCNLADFIIPPRFKDAHIRGLKHFLATGYGPIIGQRIEVSALHKNGKELPIEIIISSLKRGGEYIFNAFLHDISDRKKAESIRAIHFAATQILTEADTVSEAVTKSLEVVCKGLDWDFGAFWMPDAQTQDLVLKDAWHKESEFLDEFEAISRTMNFASGVGLPGRVWKSGQPAWVENGSTDSNFPRAAYAEKLGLHGKAAFPVAVHTECIGVIEFLSHNFHPPDHRLTEVMADIGKRVGAFIQRKRTEENLRLSEERFRRLNEELEQRVEERTGEAERREKQLRVITNALPALVAEFDGQQRYRFTNEAYQKWFDLEGKPFLGRTLSDVLGREEYGDLETNVRKVLAGEDVIFERELNRNGKKVHMSIAFIPEYDEAGRTVGFISLANDVTKHKEAKDAAEAANAAKSAFLANMSHEIRTPLGAVVGFSDLLASQHLSSSEKFNYAAAIKRNGDLLSNIISDILDLSKVEAGKLELDLQEVPMADVLSDISTMLSLQAQEKGLILRVIADEGIPQSIRTDLLRLRQIIINIVGNAIKFTQRGSVEVRIRQTSAEDGLKLIFEVKDTGPGIPPEKVAKLFSPFMQADVSTKRKFGGTGLGLVLSKRLANLLGGDVVLLESTPDQGSVFAISIDPGVIPAKPAKVQDHAEAAPPFEASRGYPRLEGIQILVIDDSPDNQLLMRRYLKMAGAIVDTADNGQEAVEKALKGSYDILLMDIQMPLMDGYEATAALRRQGYRKPIIAFTAHAMREERERCLASGFDNHISKPIHRDELLDLVVRYCSAAKKA